MQNKLIISIILLISLTFNATSQKLINSPYSRFNLGTIEPSGSFRSLGMGGVSTGFRSNNTLYYSNPASYSSIDTNSFIFDFGLDYSQNILSDGSAKHTSDDFNFDHIMLGFPIAKGWGIGAGIIPFSSGYYKMSETRSDDNVTGEYTSSHSGEGSLTNFFIGTGLKITKNISAGANMTFLFGQLNRSYQVSSGLFLSNNAAENLQISGFNFDYGLQYTAAIKKEYFFNAGVSLSAGKYYNTKYNNLSFVLLANGIRDTISNISDDSTSAHIPGTFKAGISFGKTNKFNVGVDFVTTKWSDSKIPGSGGYTADVRTILFGLEYTPDRFSNYSFVKRVDYRVGGHIGDNYLVINGEQIKEYGASIGLGIPLRRSFSKTNFFIDYTRRTGTSASNLKYEDYFTAGISLNLYDSWFLQRKYE